MASAKRQLYTPGLSLVLGPMPCRGGASGYVGKAIFRIWADDVTFRKASRQKRAAPGLGKLLRRELTEKQLPEPPAHPLQKCGPRSKADHKKAGCQQQSRHPSAIGASLNLPIVASLVPRAAHAARKAEWYHLSAQMRRRGSERSLSLLAKARQPDRDEQAPGAQSFSC